MAFVVEGENFLNPTPDNCRVVVGSGGVERGVELMCHASNIPPPHRVVKVSQCDLDHKGTPCSVGFAWASKNVDELTPVPMKV